MKERRQGYVYVLHFDRPLAHARHYVGCTCDLRQRLITHAQGHGARIVEAAQAAGITWRLGALGVTHVAGMRRLERQLKDWHGCGAQCELCQKEPRAIPGTRSYPLTSIPFPVDSVRLLPLGRGRSEVSYRFTDAGDPLALVNDLQRLMQANKWALGFIPAGGAQGLTLAVIRGQVVICLLDSVLCGYATFTESDTVKIHQVVVTDSQRGCGIGRRLVEMIRQARPDKRCECRVRDDLHANGFWQSIGFALSSHETHATSCERLNRYVAAEWSRPVAPIEGDLVLPIMSNLVGDK
jgi:GNAT superfamily N-acetyltransferase/predicted GIY-YIG superfamily endonuclease